MDEAAPWWDAALQPRNETPKSSPGSDCSWTRSGFCVRAVADRWDAFQSGQQPQLFKDRIVCFLFFFLPCVVAFPTARENHKTATANFMLSPDPQQHRLDVSTARISSFSCPLLTSAAERDLRSVTAEVSGLNDEGRTRVGGFVQHDVREQTQLRSLQSCFNSSSCVACAASRVCVCVCVCVCPGAEMDDAGAEPVLRAGQRRAGPIEDGEDGGRTDAVHIQRGIDR